MIRTTSQGIAVYATGDPASGGVPGPDSVDAAIARLSQAVTEARSAKEAAQAVQAVYADISAIVAAKDQALAAANQAAVNVASQATDQNIAAGVADVVANTAAAASGVAALNRSLLLVSSGDYGTFVGDGSPSSAAADIATINAALLAAESRKACVVLPSWARITVTPSARGNLLIARKDVTLFSQGATFKIADGSPAYNSIISHLSTVDVSGFTVDGVTFDQNKDNVQAASAASFEYAFVIQLTNGTRLRVRNCLFKNVDGLNTIVMNGYSGTDGLVRVGDVFVTDNIFENVGNDLDHDHSTIYTVASSATVARNHFFGRATAAKSAICAIEIHGSSHRVVENHIENFREAINATGVAAKTDTQVVAQNTILRCMRGIKAYSQGLAGTVSPSIRAMGINKNAIVIDPDFWAPVHQIEAQGIAFTSTQDLAVHGFGIHDNDIVFLPYTGTSLSIIHVLSGGIVYSRTQVPGAVNYDKAVSISGNTVIGALSGGVVFLGAKIQGLDVGDNTLLDCGHPTLGSTISNEYTGGVLVLSGEVAGGTVHHNRVYDTRPGGGGRRGIGWLRVGASPGSVDGTISDNDVRLVTTGHLEVAIGADTGAPLVRHYVRGGTTTPPDASTAVGSEWLVRATGVRLIQRKASAGAVWVGPSSTAAARPAAADVGVGFSLFDTTLGRPIWSTGAAWRDATGAAV